MFLYRNEISIICKKLRLLILLVTITATIIYFILPAHIGSFDILFYKNFILYSLWLFYAIGVDSKVLGNRVMKFLSNISLEIYLSHMFVFRFMEKLHFQYIFGDDSYFSYILLCLFTLIGIIALIFGYKLAVKMMQNYVICNIFKKKDVL